MWISYWTIVRKELVRLFRIWSQTLLPPVITTGLYFLVFGTFIGSQVAPMNGVTYMQFIVPGLVLMAAINSAFMNTAFSFYSAKFQKTVEEVIVSPTPYLVVVLGHITGGVLRALFTALLVMGLALFFTSLSVHSFLITIAFIVLTALLFSLAGLLNGVFATSFDTVSIVPTFVLTPLTYLGGVFYSVSLLPPVWQAISHWNPIFYMVNGFRYGMLGVTDTNILFSFVILLSLVFVLIGVNWYVFRSGKGLRT